MRLPFYTVNAQDVFALDVLHWQPLSRYFGIWRLARAKGDLEKIPKGDQEKKAEVNGS